MSTWGIGDQHDSDEVQTLKEQLRNKDAQFATLSSQLLKREDELKVLKDTLDDAVSKLRREADRTLTLEANIKQRTQELQNERTTRQNMEAALTSTQQKLKTAEQRSNELEGMLDSLSQGIQSTTSQKSSLEAENSSLKSKVKVLQAELAAKEQVEQATLRHGRSAIPGPRGRPRSSSVNNFRVTALERESSDLQNRLTQQAAELRDTKTQATCLHETLIQRENEMVAMERRLRKELNEMREELDDRQEELRMLQGSGSADTAAREAELLERLDEEERRVAMLEAELRRSCGTSSKREVTMLQSEVQRTLDLLQNERAKTADAQARLVELVADKEAALDERDHASEEVRQMQERLRIASDRMRELEARLTNSAQGSLVPFSPGRDTETAATIERLLKKIEDLRDERNGLRYEHENLRRDFEFLNDETRFTIEDLRAKLAAASVAPSATSHATPAPQLIVTGAPNRQPTALVFALVARYVVEQDAGHLSQIQALSQALTAAHDESDNKDAQLHQVQVTLSETTQSLHLAESTIAACKDIIARLEEERSRERDEQYDAGASLAEAEVRLDELSQALLEAETQRDALALQLQHTQQDLETVRHELTEADERSAQQLRSLSAGESDKALQNEIKTLHERVERRTEQIGMHQHDIKRLETNLRLQEERLAEMTAELEIMTGEKEAMVEDCRVSRDERDDARAQCETLEEKAEQLEEERDGLQATLGSAEDNAARLADQVQQLMQQRAEFESQLAELQAHLSEVEHRGQRLAADVERFGEERDALTRAVNEKTCLAEALRLEVSRMENNTLQATVALATLHTALRTTELASRTAQDAQTVAEHESALLRQDVEDKGAQLASLQQQLDAMRELQAAAEGEKEAQLLAEQARLQEELQALHSAHSELRATLERETQQSAQSAEELQQRLVEGAKTEAQLREQVAAVQTEKIEAVQMLQAQLDNVVAELEASQTSFEQLKLSHVEAETTLKGSKQELQSRLDEALTRLQETDRVGDELSAIRADQEKELEELREELDLTKTKLEEVTDARKEIAAQHDGLLEEVELLKTELSEKTKAYVAAEAEFEQFKDCELEEMQDRLDAVAREAKQAHKALSELETKYQRLSEESTSAKGQLENQLTSAQDEVDYLKATLRGEMDLHARTQKEHDEAIRFANEKTADGEREGDRLRQEISALRAQLEEAESSMQTLENERTALQYEATSMGAEVQRCKSLQRYLESQVKESEARIQSLSDDLEEARTKLMQSEKAYQGLDAESSMRGIQQEQTINALKRDLQALRANPSLEEKIADLEEQNMHLEDILRNKCAEIEDNDDRIIELLKEKKKFTNKIDSLTRKLQASQSKLEASETSTPAPVAVAGPSAHALRLARSSPAMAPRPYAPKPEHMTQPPPSLPTPTYTPTTPNSRSRIASGSSALPRPKTPESRTSQPVFRARTPEAKRTPLHAPPVPPIPAMTIASSSSAPSMVTTSTAGKKRRAPDDFDDGEGLPPQGFTADCLPVHQPATPRARRALQAVRTGFTPVRNHVAQLSPRRATAAALPPPIIADVTNSPRSKGASQEAAAAKRGWLGKIRNGSGQARAVSSRPVFDRR